MICNNVQKPICNGVDCIVVLFSLAIFEIVDGVLSYFDLIEPAVRLARAHNLSEIPITSVPTQILQIENV